METSAPQQPAAPSGERLVSLDALRGFDMLWIVGGDGLFLAIYKLIAGHQLPAGWNQQFEHVSGTGFISRT